MGWQDNDLPQFGRIQVLMMVSHVPIAAITLYATLGIDRHYHSYAVSCTSQVKTIGIEKLEGYPPVFWTLYWFSITVHSGALLCSP